ncbi:hypothetical protein [Agrobacterium sp. CFBP2214]|uniref:hypothetical protein n=1 Tax=Agrobacterium sp. CFBP2214 TaxID=3040274 RepID=UPI00254C4A8E|nr:hypothetical protein [Agrobacterium sp. CFBP2214]
MADEDIKPGHSAEVYSFPTGLKSGGGGGTFDGMEARVKSLEDDMKKILQDTAEIKGMLRAAPSAIEFGEMKGRLNSLPTTAKVATIVAIAAGLVTILTRWNELSALFK